MMNVQPTNATIARRYAAKARAMSRRAARSAKSARVLMAIAFPAELGAFAPAGQ